MAPETENAVPLPPGLIGLVLRISGWHQMWLVLLTILVFVADTMPLEVQRRLVNAAVKGGEAQVVVMYAAFYALLAFGYGALKLSLNVYRGWVGETAVRWLRNEISLRARDAPTSPPAHEASGLEIAMEIAEADPIGSFVGSSVSEPLLQSGVILVVVTYLIYLKPLMAVVVLMVFIPQLLLVPFIQAAISQRVGARIEIMRQISIALASDGNEGRDLSRYKSQKFEQVFQLNMGIYELKFTLNFAMNFLVSVGTAFIFGLGGYFVIQGQTEIGTVLAFVSSLAKISSPWGDLVDWFREFRITKERYRLVVHSLNG